MPVLSVNKQQARGEDSRSSPSQQKAIAHASGSVQVLAGPGSGKTYLIIRRIRHLICHHGISPDKILVITFTKAAALEMQERFAQLTSGRFQTVSFGTFHAIYYHIWKQSGEGRNGRPATAMEKSAYLKHSLALCGIEGADSDTMEKIFQEISRRKNDSAYRANEAAGNRQKAGKAGNPGLNRVPGQNRISPKGAGPGFTVSEEAVKEHFPDIFKEYCRIMEENHRLDFDDMIIFCSNMLSGHPAILSHWQNRYSHILVDEFQDISPLQYRILRQLAAPGNHLFTVGDDDQSIYGFRGTGPGIMRQFMQDYPGASQIFLDINYRCRESIVQAASLVIGENTDRFPKSLRAMKAGGEKVRLCCFASWEEEAEYLAGRLGGMPAEELQETAVICRTHAQFYRLSNHLAKSGIPFQIHGKKESLLEHPVSKDLLAYLHFAKDSFGPEGGNGKRADFLRIMNKPSRYINREAVGDGIDVEKALAGYYRGIPYMQEPIRKLFANFQRIAALRPYLAVDYIRKSAGYDTYLSDKKDGMGTWMETADRIQETMRGFSTLAEWESHLASHEEKRETKGATFITMHSAKGLEYHTVLLPDVNAKVIPHSKAVSPEQVEEERRLFYVAMTRARERLEILSYGQPSCFLEKLKQSPSVCLQTTPIP